MQPVANGQTPTTEPYRKTESGTGASPNRTTAAESGAMIADFGQFLQLFVSQLKYQDPLSPLNGEEFLAQTAQFSSVEQLVSLNRKTGDSAAAVGLFTRASAAALIGRIALAHATDESGGERDVKGRVVRVEYGKDGELLLGLEDGTSVRFADVVTISET
jgi:flagellar basal-body rod modification protein FlgD